MPQREFTITESDLEKILEKMRDHVFEGLSATKEVQSNLWGDMQTRFSNIEKILAQNAENTEQYRKKQDEDSTVFKKHISVFQNFMERVEPVVLAFEKAKIVRESDGERGDTVVKWSVRIGAVGIIGSAALWVWTKLKGL